MNTFTSIRRKLRHGFTLIELLLVIGIIAILASIVIVAINPTKQLADARNAQRRSDVNTILNAVYQYAIDNNGTLPGSIPVATTSGNIICAGGTAAAACVTTVAGSTRYIRLNGLTGSYLVSLPIDPSTTASTATGTNYRIFTSTTGRVTVRAPAAENSATITVTR